MHNIAVTFNLAPVLQKSKNSEFSKRLEAFSIDFDFYKIQYYLNRSRLNAILFVLEHFSREEENEWQISLALYIRLEYRLETNVELRHTPFIQWSY